MSFGDAMHRLYADPGISAEEAAALGGFLHNLLSPVSTPGPPYTRTLVPPEPIGEDEDGNDIHPEPGPAFTLKSRGRIVVRDEWPYWDPS